MSKQTEKPTDKGKRKNTAKIIEVEYQKRCETFS